MVAERDALDEKRWGGVSKPIGIIYDYDIEKFKKEYFDEMENLDTALIQTDPLISRFYNAYHKLDSWDIPYKPKDYLDKLLILPDKKPKSVVYRFPPKGKKAW